MQPLVIGTRESELAVWQAKQVQLHLQKISITSELKYINSEGDIDLVTPLYEMGVQGIFTKTLDAALLNKRIDIAVHSMKDVPTQLPPGIRQAAVLERGSYKDLLVFKSQMSDVNGQSSGGNREWSMGNGQSSEVNGKLEIDFLNSPLGAGGIIIATSSIRRKAQWQHRYPHHTIENLRGNVNTRLRKLGENNWNAAIFAAAGLERINLRPQNSIELDWMLPAPAQGAIMIVCREEDNHTYKICHAFNDKQTEICTKIERDFLRQLMGGCSTPISALTQITNDTIIFKGNLCSTDGKQKIGIEKEISIHDYFDAGANIANELLNDEAARYILEEIKNAKK